MERTQLLQVEGWSNSRYAQIQGNLILFEVMSLGCGCGTCLRRLDAVKDRMKTADVRSWRTVELEIPERGFVPSVILAVEPKEMPAQMDNYLSDLLGLQISAR